MSKFRIFFRKLRSSVRDYILWIRQGKPTDGPVVVNVGELTITKDGKKSITNWGWCFRYTDNKVTVDSLWEFLSERYPVKTLDK